MTVTNSFAALCLILAATFARAQGTAFNYQGRLTDQSFPANGKFDFAFSIFDNPTGGSSLGAPFHIATPASNGVFNVTIDFGSQVFTGSDRWLEISVRTNGALDFVTLTPRQPIKPTPYAIHAGNVASVGGQSAGNVAAAVAAVNSSTPDATANTLVKRDNNGGLSADTIAIAGNLMVPRAFDVAVSNGRPLFVAPDGRLGLGSGTNSSIQITGGDGLDGGGAVPLGGSVILHNTGVLSVKGDSDILATRAAGAVSLSTSATASNAPNVIVKRDGNGDFSTRAMTVQSISSDGNLFLQPDLRKGSVIVGGGFNGAGRFVVNSYALDGGSSLAINAEGNLTLQPDMRKGDVVIGGGFDGGKFRVNVPAEFVQDASVKTLTIRGGADISEPFHMPQSIEKGSVVIIDEDNPGQLKLSGEPYDNRVAGIVSGANGVQPGLSLSQRGVIEGGQNVALTGRVYALADASQGPIRPGDLLTTASTPGHCMKVTDYTRAPGAVIGKAMSPLNGGKGMVLVLVSLQ